MAGDKTTSIRLNDTLKYFVKLLHENNINHWFIAYGTLLGFIRENSCIDGDDDVDIIMDRTNFILIQKILSENGIKRDCMHWLGKSTNIIKTLPTDKYCSVDFYMADMDKSYNFNDTWTTVLWSDCYINGLPIVYTWKDTILYIPNNAETKLALRYGDSWKIPQNSKGPLPAKEII